MNKFNPTIELEQQLGQQIYTALQGAVVEEVLRKTKTNSSDAYWRSAMEGHCMKVQPELLPDFYNLCHEVKSQLNFDEPVDFSEMEIATAIAQTIQRNFVLSLNSIV